METDLYYAMEIIGLGDFKERVFDLKTKNFKITYIRGFELKIIEIKIIGGDNGEDLWGHLDSVLEPEKYIAEEQDIIKALFLETDNNINNNNISNIGIGSGRIKRPYVEEG